jgi:hypothetical protein
VTLEGVPADDLLWPQQSQLLDLIASRIGAAITTQVCAGEAKQAAAVAWALHMQMPA